MDNNNISEKLKTLARGGNRSATARLREIFNEIETALRSGVRRKDIHQALKESGFDISFSSFELAIYRIRKERGKPETPTQLPFVLEEKKLVQNTKPAIAADMKNEEIIRPPGITDAGWSEMKAKTIQELMDDKPFGFPNKKKLIKPEGA